MNPVQNYLLLKQMIKNISSINNDSDNIIDLNKTSRQESEEKKSE